ncbi:type II secretion system F family protein [Lawsonibacter faecis]|uniref:Type II secretion system F family protein n=1 Tax=Lawsonibacter faecis TaxID=2763052 RepID=A0A8J6JL57_9FIRM|nr:type II secretion system F family protein [Lawsonibacter faecis]MBC5736829.1 type II secretion system F family protein [Lawsonibacter faecis]
MGSKQNVTLPPEALSVFCSQLALMLRSGIGSEEAVDILAGDAQSAPVKDLLTRLHASLLQGAPLSRALEDCGTFPGYMVRMVEIGQAAGRLDQVLSALSDYYRREADTAASIRRAVLYPAVMAILVALVFLVLVTRVLPVFQQVFNQLGVSLSPVAQGLLRAGEAGKYVGAALVALLAVGAAALLLSRRQAKTARSLESRLLRRGAAGLAVDRSRFSSAMALMLSSGLPLDESMDRTVRLLEGAPLAPRLSACRTQMEDGVNFSKAVAACGILDGLQAGLLGAGFRAGVPEQAMEELAARCQAEADDALGRLLSKLEFSLVILLCAAVGLVLLSVMLPLLGVLAAIG